METRKNYNSPLDVVKQQKKAKIQNTVKRRTTVPSRPQNRNTNFSTYLGPEHPQTLEPQQSSQHEVLRTPYLCEWSPWSQSISL